MTFVKTSTMQISWLEWRLGDSLGISVTDETLQRSEAAHRTPPGSSALRESEASAAKRPAGTEINHTFCDEP